MLLEMAIGDAYGAGLEYVSPKHVRENNNLKVYGQHPRHRIKPGSYTDDTQMALAIAEALVDGVEWTKEELAERFVSVFKRDPREGYAHRFYEFLCAVADGSEFLAKIRPSSDKSGAAMRAGPIGLFEDIEEVIRRSRLQATLTHDTPAGIHAAIAASLMVHYFAYDLGPKIQLGRFVESRVPGDWATAWKGKVGPKGWMSVRAAITAIEANDSFSSVLRACIDFGGDVDTVAAIAMGTVSMIDGFDLSIPAPLLSGLENAAYGRDYLVGLDRRLAERFPNVAPLRKGASSALSESRGHS